MFLHLTTSDTLIFKMSQSSSHSAPSRSLAEADALHHKLQLAETKNTQLTVSNANLRQQLHSHQLSITSLQNQLFSLRETSTNQEFYHSKALEYMNEEIKLKVKSQQVWIDYLKRENTFLKERSKVKGDATRDSELLRLEKSPINMLLWKVEELSSERLTEDSKFKKLLLPFFSALYRSTTTDQLFEECIQLFRNCGEYDKALTKGERVASMLDEFKRQAELIIGDDDESFELSVA